VSLFTIYVLTIYLIQAQVRGWTSTNECKQKPNKHQQPKWAQTRANEHEWARTKAKQAQTNQNNHEQKLNEHDQVADKHKQAQQQRQ